MWASHDPYNPPYIRYGKLWNYGNEGATLN